MTSNLLTADLINEPKLTSARISRDYLGVRLGRFQLSVHRRWRGGCSFKWCRGHYLNLCVCSRTHHAWWAVMVYFYYDASWRSRA